MITFVAGRVLQGIAALFVLSIVVFGMSRATGDPRGLLLPLTASEADYKALGHTLGLDKPLPVQYLVFLQNLVHGDLGLSQSSGVPVTSLLRERLPKSLELAFASLVLTLVVGIPLGVLSAVRAGRPTDSAAKFVALLGQSMPSFWVGIMLIQLFAVTLAWAPPGTGSSFSSLILPSITLALFGIAGVTRLLRSSMLEILPSEFVKLARTKGLSETRVIWKHALRNALLSVVSFSGLLLTNMISLAIVVEIVFAWPGLGSLTTTAIATRDFPLIQGVALVAGALAIVVNLLADVAYMYLDPRLRRPA